jgi:hypothetical protein
MSAERPLNKRPAGAEKYDPQALNEDQQRKTNAKKVRASLFLFKTYMKFFYHFYFLFRKLAILSILLKIINKKKTK